MFLFGPGFYPEHGSHVIAEGIVPVIEAAGGKVMLPRNIESETPALFLTTANPTLAT